MRALEVFGFKHDLTGASNHPVDALDGTSESMLSSGISRNIFIWVLVQDSARKASDKRRKETRDGRKDDGA
jgi:hypothetical protein